MRITIAYDFTSDSSSRPERGQVHNSVALGSVHLNVSGPIKLLSPKNILAFDFTRLHLQTFGQRIYRGHIRGGAEREARFDTDAIGHQAFFAYFWVTEQAIAARGKGGGLALWSRVIDA